MSVRFLLNLLLVGILLTGFFFTPKQVFAQDACRDVCTTNSNLCRLSRCIIAIPNPPLLIVCNLTCAAEQALCTHNCPALTTTPTQRQQICQADPTRADCRVPSSAGIVTGGCLVTAIGCVPIDFQGFIQGFLRFSYAIGGVVAFVLMILGAFQMLTSAGNPEAIKKGRDQFIAAATGLVFVVLSTAILRIIGVDILGIPGF